MKKALLSVIVGASLLYGNQIQENELEQIKQEIQQLKSEEATLNVLKPTTVENYAIDEDIDNFLNEFYNTLGGKRSYILKNYKISDASRARIHYINVEAEVEWELSSNDEKLTGTSVNFLQLMELDGEFSIVAIKEGNEV